MGRSSNEIREKGSNDEDFFLVRTRWQKGQKRPTAVTLKVVCLVEGDNQRVDVQRWRTGK